MKKIIAMMALAAVSAGNVFAADSNNQKHLTIDADSMMIQELPVPADAVKAAITRHGGGAPVPSSNQLPPPPSVPSVPSVPPPPAAPAPSFGEQMDNAGQVVGLIDQIVNLVDKVFGIIAKNQPVVNINVNYANAVPYGVSHWTQLQNWKTPAVKRYQITYKNGLGGEVVNIVYQLHYTYGGTLNGKGQFLTGVTIEPISVNTAWGYNVDMTAEVPDSTIANVGTSEDPIASMQVQLKYKIHTIMSDVQEKVIFYVRGDGQSKNLTASKANV
ncbi:MAG: hypothetical protein J5706_04160, partial [Elusimicrobiales bacterium]|nr:hypothetical protein [Elusimicrobiales bacterium]